MSTTEEWEFLLSASQHFYILKTKSIFTKDRKDVKGIVKKLQTLKQKCKASDNVTSDPTKGKNSFPGDFRAVI